MSAGEAFHLATEGSAKVLGFDKIGRLDKILLDVRFALRDTGRLRYRWFSD